MRSLLSTARLLPIPALLIAATALVGCDDGGEAAPAQPKVQVVSGHAAPEKGDAEKMGFTCCTDPTHTALLVSFSELGAALAADDEAGSKTAAGAFSAAAGAATAAPPVAAIAAAAKTAAGEATIDEIRAAYLAASVPALELARASKGGDTSLVVAYCPMKPGRWLQQGGPLANPYYGAKMLRCGAFEAL